MHMHINVCFYARTYYTCIVILFTVSIVKICLHVQCMFRRFTVYEVCIILWNSFASVPCSCGKEIISHNRQCGASLLPSYSTPNTTQLCAVEQL